MNLNTVLIGGSTGAIAQALIDKHVSDGWTVITVGRQSPTSAHHCQAELTDPQSVSVVAEWLQHHNHLPDRVIACMGILHTEQHGPEKMLSQLSTAWLEQSMSINLHSHIHLAQAVNTVMSRRKPVTWASLSAKVGSIADNGLGGWHSYRMTKAALNMFIHNLSIEWQRKNSQNCAIAIHPGTTDSALSVPFQAHIANGKLYTATTTADRLISVFDNLPDDASGEFFNWDGSRLPW
ncbi:C-factor [BD1-7 clade bacterium]|uniref:C-factor n=1 Tax=BD1-7 clade bacterium TaxID=2029982 RepID=A0A5S9QUU2_9GAMM|nr:C-factor [BD1-7 clade bacterium]